MTRTGDVDTDIYARIGKASAVFRRLRNVWRCSTSAVTPNCASTLHSSYLLPYNAGETSTSVAKTRHMLDVFNGRCLRNILGISWKDHVSNEELFKRTKVDNLHDTVDKRRRRSWSRPTSSISKTSQSSSGLQKVGKEEEADLKRHGSTRYVMTYKRWMSAGKGPSLLLVTARSGDRSSPSVPA